jgi:hypothetical protein
VPGGAEQIHVSAEEYKDYKKGEETTVAKIKDIICSPKTKMVI